MMFDCSESPTGRAGEGDADVCHEAGDVLLLMAAADFEFLFEVWFVAFVLNDISRGADDAGDGINVVFGK